MHRCIVLQFVPEDSCFVAQSLVNLLQQRQTVALLLFESVFDSLAVVVACGSYR